MLVPAGLVSVAQARLAQGHARSGMGKVRRIVGSVGALEGDWAGVGRPAGNQGADRESGKQVPSQVRADSVPGDAAVATEKLGVLCQFSWQISGGTKGSRP